MSPTTDLVKGPLHSATLRHATYGQGHFWSNGAEWLLHQGKGTFPYSVPESEIPFTLDL